MKIIAVCSSNRGKVRINNEDNFFENGEILSEDSSETIYSEENGKKMNLFAVFDGMGGEHHGEIASKVAARRMQQVFWKKRSEHCNREEMLLELCHDMNQQVCLLQNKYSASTGTTVSALLFEKNQVIACNVGDSPIFVVRDNHISRIYEEHTNRRLLQMRGSSRKPELMQCLGIPEDEMLISPYIQQYEVKKDDWYLICSDGLTDMMSEKDILMIIQENAEPKQKVKDLMDKALEQGGTDNITAILINIREE